MPEIQIVGRGVDTLVLNVCYTNDCLQPVKRELEEGLQRELNQLQNMARLSGRLRVLCSLCKRKGRVGNGVGYCGRRS